MEREGFGAIADLLPHPAFLITAEGAIVAANRVARARSAHLPEKILDVLQAPPERLLDYLRLCSRVRTPAVGAFDVHGLGRHRTEGAVVRPRTPHTPALIFLRLIPEPESAAAFRVLNHKLESLRSEMAARARTEAEVRREREWLRVTLMSIGDAVIATDAQGRVELMNPVAQALTGWREPEAVGRPLSEVFYIVNEDTRQIVESPVDKVLRDKVTVGLANHTVLIARDGIEWPIDDSAAPIRDESGELLGIVLVFHEVSERRRLERLAAGRLQELAEVNRRKDEFLAMLAHELRNPLAPILMATAILKSPDSRPQAVAQARTVVERHVRHMVRLVDDLLDASRITRGKIELRKERTEVRPILDGAIEATRPLIDELGHALEVSIAAPLPPVLADSTRLEQVVCNLLNNAAKYTPRGGRIKLEASEGDGQLIIRVTDEGIGMSPELMSRVFELFVQGDSSLHRSQGGLGIGLTLVKHLVELHDGTVSCSSDGPDRGSEFVVRLPVTDVTPSRAEAGHRQPQSNRGLKLLVVDDNEDAAELLSLYLQDAGYDVLVAHDGPRALELARVERPDAVLLDIGLPGMDGYEVARRLRQAPTLRECILIALTGYGQEEHRRRSAEAGIAYHLTKPVDPTTLLSLLSKVPRARR